MPITLDTTSPHFSEVKVWNNIQLILDLIFEPEAFHEKYQKALNADANTVDAVIELALFRHFAQNRTWTKARIFPVRRSSKKKRNRSFTLFFSLRTWR